MAPLSRARPLLLLLSLVAPCIGLRAAGKHEEAPSSPHAVPEGRGSGKSGGLRIPDQTDVRKQPVALPVVAGPPGIFDAKRGTCTPLTNQGTHFTARIEVGTPPQSFDVVADTGSDSVVLTSCYCKELKKCKQEAKCYHGYNTSSTFAIPAADKDTVPSVELSFGSGVLQAVVASDVVRVGSATATLDNGLLLMVNQAMQLSGPFEGILGLGLPRQRGAKPVADKMDLKPRPKSEWQNSPLVMKLINTNTGELMGGPHDTSSTIDSVKDSQEKDQFHARSFLETANIPSFSMCFNDGADGVLRLGGKRDGKKLDSIGKEHWGLEMAGFWVGNTSMNATLCGPDTIKRPNQKTACGAIPDSGTTVVLAPADHIKIIFETLCDNWQRCRDAVATGKYKMRKLTKWEVLTTELMHCADWIDEEGLQSMPNLNVKLRGANGEEQMIELPPHLYVLEMMGQEVSRQTKKLFGFIPYKAKSISPKHKMCAPAFNQMEYNTAVNGPVWVLGSSIFYKYQVTYDMKSAPPSIGFSQEPCGSCTSQTSLVAISSLVKHGAGRERHSLEMPMPRRISGPLLIKEYDTSLPL